MLEINPIKLEYECISLYIYKKLNYQRKIIFSQLILNKNILEKTDLAPIHLFKRTKDVMHENRKNCDIKNHFINSS